MLLTRIANVNLLWLTNFTLICLTFIYFHNWVHWLTEAVSNLSFCSLPIFPPLWSAFFYFVFSHKTKMSSNKLVSRLISSYRYKSQIKTKFIYLKTDPETCPGWSQSHLRAQLHSWTNNSLQAGGLLLGLWLLYRIIIGEKMMPRFIQF